MRRCRPFSLPRLPPLFLALFLVFFSIVTYPAQGYPKTAEPLFGLRRLHEYDIHPENSRRMTMEFLHEDEELTGRRVEVSYDVELAPHITQHNTDKEEHLSHVFGKEGGEMQLIFTSAAAASDFEAALSNGDLFHGHYQHHHQEGEEVPVLSYHARVLSKKMEGEALIVTTDTPGFTEVFINANVKISVAAAPEDHKIILHNNDNKKKAEGGAGTEKGEGMKEKERGGGGGGKRGCKHQRRNRKALVVRRELKGFKDFVKKGLSFIKKIGSVVKTALDVVVDVFEFLATGDWPQNGEPVTGSKTVIDLFSFNYNLTQCRQMGAFRVEDKLGGGKEPALTGVCEQCYAYSQLTILFELQIKNYDLIKFVTMLDGNLDFSLYLDKLVLGGVGKSDEYQGLARTFQGPAFKVFVGGMPVHLTTTAPIFFGAEVDIETAATFSVDMMATASLQAGMRWVKSAMPQRQLVNKVDFAYGGKGIKLLRFSDGQAHFRMYLLPTVKLHISLGEGLFAAQLGGPNIAMRTYAEAITTSAGGTKAQIVTNFGADGTLGLNMTIQMGSKEKPGGDLLKGKGLMPPLGIYKGIFPFGSETVDIMSLPFMRRKDIAPYSSGTTSTTSTTSTSTTSTTNTLSPLPYDWANVGTTFEGSLERLKNLDSPSCSELSNVPAYLQLSAVVLESVSMDNGGYMKMGFTYTYGQETPSYGWEGFGAYAAITQKAYGLSIYWVDPKVPNTFPSCDRVTSMLKELSDYPEIDYAAKTMDDSITLPPLVGGFCDGGNKLFLKDTMSCVRVVLDRNRPAAVAGRSLSSSEDMSSRIERRRQLGHAERFGRILKQCSQTLQTPATAAAAAPITAAPSVAKTAAPSAIKTAAPSVLSTTAPSAAKVVTGAPSATITAAPSVAKAVIKETAAASTPKSEAVTSTSSLSSEPEAAPTASTIQPNVASLPSSSEEVVASPASQPEAGAAIATSAVTATASSTDQKAANVGSATTSTASNSIPPPLEEETVITTTTATTSVASSEAPLAIAPEAKAAAITSTTTSSEQKAAAAPVSSLPSPVAVVGSSRASAPKVPAHDDDDDDETDEGHETEEDGKMVPQVMHDDPENENMQEGDVNKLTTNNLIVGALVVLFIVTSLWGLWKCIKKRRAG